MNASSSRISVGRDGFFALLIFVVAVLGAHWNGLRGAFVFDDFESIHENRSIRSIDTAFNPPSDFGVTVGGRPLLNASFALNHALGGFEPAGYHAFNLLVHLGAGLLLRSFVRRTLGRIPVFASAPPRELDWLAWGVALLWALHPLQTAAVTYVVQRAEVLAAFFILAALWSGVRGVESPRPWRWWSATLGCALAGVATKESAVVVLPLLVIYDRLFFAASWRLLWAARRALYLGVAATWVPLAWLVLNAGGRGGTAGLDAGVAAFDYGVIQVTAVAHYLRLVLWPSPLVFDYGARLPLPSPAVLLGSALLLGTILIAVAIGMRRRAAWAFSGIWFFAVLAPSSSIVPIATQGMAEHRMYLALAAPLALGLALGYARCGRVILWAVPPVALALGALTFARNETFRIPLALWADTVAKKPENPRAWINLGWLQLGAGDAKAARESFQAAVNLDPGLARGWLGLGDAFLAEGNSGPAVAALRRAVSLDNLLGRAQARLGVALLSQGLFAEAIRPLVAAVILQPESAENANNLAIAFAETGRHRHAKRAYELALRLAPEDMSYGVNLAWLLATSQDVFVRDGPRAVALVERALAGGRQADMRALRTLAAAYAAAQRNQEALQVAGRAFEMAKQRNDRAMQEALRLDARAYRGAMVRGRSD